MKHSTAILLLCTVGSAIAACSAVNPGGATGGAGGNGGMSGGASTGSVVHGPSSSSGKGTGTGPTGTTGAGIGGATTSSGGPAAGSGGAATTSASGATSTSVSTGSGPSDAGIDFDGGWQIPDSGVQNPLVGDGGTTVEIGPGANAGSPGKFGGAVDPAAKPTLVYPPDGVVVPPNMHSIEFHFIPAPGQTLFEFTFHAPTTNLTAYVGCTPLNGGCVYTPDAGFWSNLVDYARGTQPVKYTVRGVNGSNPSAVGTSVQQTIAFSQENIAGGIYYWNTAGTVERYDFGYPNAPPQLYLTAVNAGGFFCVGCHVLSRGGDKIAAGVDIPSPAPYKVLDVVTKMPLMAGGQPLSGSSNFFSFSPDGKQLLTSDGAKIGWRDLTSGVEVNPAVVAQGTMPDWSPDGLHMVYARPSQPVPFGFPVPGVGAASLELLHFNGFGWDAPATLVPFAGQNNYYPSFSPTGDWVAFNRSPSNAESFANAGPDPDAGTVPDGELWAVSAKGGAAVRLDAASDPGALSWPKWAPVLQDYYGGKIMWLTISSARAYGLRLPKGAQTQLWMVGFDLAKAALGKDPSLPAFWLPFQDIASGNHIAQWSTAVPRKPCVTVADCDLGEVCVGGHCAPG